MKDEILEEVWKAKDTLAAKDKYNIHAMFQDLRERERASGAKYVRLKQRKLKNATR